MAPPERLHPRTRRRRRRWYASGVVVGVISTVLVIAGLVKIPYYTLAPGSVRSTEPLVRVEGTEVFPGTDDISFTTVSFGEATVLTGAMGWLDPAVEVIDKEQALNGQAPEENRRRNLEMMDSSKQTAQVVALRRLGHDVTATGTGAVIAFVKEDAPVAKVIEVNDVVLAVDGAEVKVADDLVQAVGRGAPGDTVTLRVEDGGDGEVREVQTTLLAREGDPTKPMLGIQAGTRNISFELPFSVSIDSGQVGGPSAGLAFTLGVIDVLTPGSLTGGKRVATTGTIDLRGNVGPVGGVPQKTVAARASGAELFLVPPGEYEQAIRFAGSMQVVQVDTLDGALQALADAGNDPSAVALAASPSAVEPA